jgi:hypothetical protein
MRLVRRFSRAITGRPRRQTAPPINSMSEDFREERAAIIAGRGFIMTADDIALTGDIAADASDQLAQLEMSSADCWFDFSDASTAPCDNVPSLNL